MIRAVRPSAAEEPSTLSRRAFLASAGALTLAASLPVTRAFAQAGASVAPGSRVSAFLEILPDGGVRLLSPFVEGGQGIATGMAQMVAEELDVDPARFEVECAPPGPDYLFLGGLRFTGGSYSTRSSYEIMRRLGAAARDMLMRGAAERMAVPKAELATDDGKVIHAATGRSLGYGELAEAAMALEPDLGIALRDPATFRWIGKETPRIDVRAKSTGAAKYAIDLTVENMLFAAVVHAPFLGTRPISVANEEATKAMPGVHSLHMLDGAVAVCADSWWRARMAVEAAEITWSDPPSTGFAAASADFSSAGMLAALRGWEGDVMDAEAVGDAAGALEASSKVIEADYDAPYLNHAQLEPPSALAKFDPDGTLHLWLPNQAPEMFQASAAEVAGIEPAQVHIHSPILGGFFGRHFVYGAANPYPQAIQLAKETGRPVKLVWSREEEFAMDALRPLSATRFRGAVGPDGMPVAIEARTVGEGPMGRYFGVGPVDSSAVEGIVDKPYAIPNRRVVFGKLPHPVTIAFWRSVGHSMNDFFYESFLDELAEAGGKDPFEMRRDLLASDPRRLRLLDELADLCGGWKGGPFDVEGETRARGVAMASPFGSETATAAEVSITDGEVKVHDVWVAFDPGSVVNPKIVRRQVESAVALGLSETLVEQAVYENGRRRDANFDTYAILDRSRMPRVHVRIVESGAPMGGVGEPGLPGVPPAVANAVAVLTGRRPRSLPLSGMTFS